MSISREEVSLIITKALVDLFDIDESDINMDADLYEDLDIDSIDAVDLIVRLKQVTGRKPDVEEFKHVRKVSDIVDLIYVLVNKKQV